MAEIGGNQSNVTSSFYMSFMCVFNSEVTYQPDRIDREMDGHGN